MSTKANNDCGFDSFMSTHMNETYVASSCFDIGDDCWKPNVNVTGYGDNAYLSIPYSRETDVCLTKNNANAWISKSSVTSEDEDDGDSSAYKSGFSKKTLASSVLLIMASLTLVSA